MHPEPLPKVRFPYPKEPGRMGLLEIVIMVLVIVGLIIFWDYLKKS
jgi:hypothetical protein